MISSLFIIKESFQVNDIGLCTFFFLHLVQLIFLFVFENFNGCFCMFEQRLRKTRYKTYPVVNRFEKNVIFSKKNVKEN